MTDPMTIVVDSREQRPYLFDGLCPYVVLGLPSGDYSVRGYEHVFAIERKSLSDAYHTCSRERARFERELERLASYDEAHVVLEFTMEDALTPPPGVRRVQPGTVLNSFFSWARRYGIHVWYVGSRDLGRTTVYRLAERFWRDKVRAARGAA